MIETTKAAVDKVFGDNWPVRRRVMFLFLVWQAVMVSWIICVKGTDSSLYGTAITTIFASMTSIICAYIFGAVWDDHNKRMRLKFQPDEPEESTS